jgi:hypothetical protein
MCQGTQRFRETHERNMQVKQRDINCWTYVLPSCLCQQGNMIAIKALTGMNIRIFKWGWFLSCTL